MMFFEERFDEIRTALLGLCPNPRSLSLLFSSKWTEKTGDKKYRPFRGKIRTVAQVTLLRFLFWSYYHSEFYIIISPILL